MLAFAMLCPNQLQLAPAIDTAATKYGLDPVALVVLMHAESACKEGVENKRTGALGLFQILPGGTANPDLLTHEQILKPETNIDIGAAALARLLGICGSLSQAFTLYHGGGKKDPNTGRTKCQTDAHARKLMRRIQEIVERKKIISFLPWRTSVA